MKNNKTKTPKDTIEFDGEYDQLRPNRCCRNFSNTFILHHWDYTVQDNRIKKLYELGKELNWNVEVDVD